jgi:site-specific recombinase XerC
MGFLLRSNKEGLLSRNFGLGSRDMGKAGQFACNSAVSRGEMSYSTAATVGERWGVFVEWAKNNGINKMEQVDRSTVEAYGRELAEQVAAGEMSPAYAQNLVSAVNSVLAIATGGQWQTVSPTKDCAISERSHVREDPPSALDRSVYSNALAAVRDALGERAAAVVELAREFGLRSKEASLLDARAALREAEARGAITVSAGTKGGREREVPITSERQIEALQRAADAQGRDHSLIPADQSWKTWREGTLRDTREMVQSVTGGGLHDLRSSYACERYSELTGWAAPVAGGVIEDRQADRDAREVISAELGHGRIDVVSEYIGGR